MSGRVLPTPTAAARLLHLLTAWGALHLPLNCFAPSDCRSPAHPLAPAFLLVYPFLLDTIEHIIYNNTIPHFNNFTPFYFLSGNPSSISFLRALPASVVVFLPPRYSFLIFFSKRIRIPLPPPVGRKNPSSPMAVLKTSRSAYSFQIIHETNTPFAARIAGPQSSQSGISFNRR